MSRLRETIVFGPGNFYRIERWSGNDRCVEIVNGPGSVERIPAFGAHWHYHRAVEMTCVFRGTSTCFVADQLQRFSDGELFVLGENVPHYWHHPRGSEGLSILWEFPEEHGIWELNDMKPLRLLAARALCGLSVVGTAGRDVCRRVGELARTGGLSRLGGLFQLLDGLLHIDPAETHLVARQPFDLTGTNEQEEAVRRAMSYLHANYREEIQLADLLRVTNMGRTTFTRQFQRHAGMCYTTYLNRIRLKAVCRELKEGKRTISSIALTHGFTQLSFFNRLFRRELGVSPKVYREQQCAVRVA